MIFNESRNYPKYNAKQKIKKLFFSEPAWDGSGAFIIFLKEFVIFLKHFKITQSLYFSEVLGLEEEYYILSKICS